MADRRKRLGAHYTPVALAGFVAERVVELLGDAPPRVLDPACGDGELLAAVAKLRPDAELVGYDLDPDAVVAARARLPEAVIERRDFTDDAPTGGRFDAVITNPPYVRTQVLGSAAAPLAARFGLSGRIDLTHPFVAMVPRLLVDGGVLGLICSNRFLTTKAGANVRERLAADFAVREVFDLGDTKLFEAAVLPAVVVAVKGAETGAARFASAYEFEVPAEEGDLFAALMGQTGTAISFGGRSFRVDVGTLVGGQTWRLSTPDRERRLNRIAERTWRTLGELARVRVGIKTTADPVFIRADWADVEPDLLRPLLTHEDISAWAPPRAPRLRVLYPYLDRPTRQVVRLDDYPRAAAYLSGHRDRLAARRYLVEAGREWFEIWVPQRPAAWRAPKIVFPDISPEPRFTIDRGGSVVNGDCYWISVPELGEDLAHLVLGVANSPFGARFYDEVCGNRLYAGRRRWITQYVARLPLPDPSTAASRLVIDLARRLTQVQDPTLLAELAAAVPAAFGEVE
ncbi:type II DNA modification methyltransferase [Alloactinosynnema sp. L-07]|uniref:Eco57I restriction-modification methylase domain-containing protein n=1 Tax=Alloactinosynnema sp. L-07 TaxID=1653480 RepID=UPI00065F05E5|nr:methyltransferase [Alloactinosynnema sp. L-07]CRK60796.1 type II DNA modification methyltransferase [Alloactinosynnema sp. L-07]